MEFSYDGALLVREGMWSNCDYGETCYPEEDRGDVRFWEAASGEPILLLARTSEGIQKVPHGRLLAVSSWEGVIALWGLPPDP